MDEFALRIEEESKNTWEMFCSATGECSYMWASDRRIRGQGREEPLCPGRYIQYTDIYRGGEQRKGEQG
jgi:hypothetical protein